MCNEPTSSLASMPRAVRSWRIEKEPEVDEPKVPENSTMSSSAPVRPDTEKLPTVENSRLPPAVKVAASTSSAPLPPRPTSEPSNSRVNEPEVDAPRVPVKVNRSSSAPEAPVPLKPPVVDTTRLPPESKVIESTSSPFEVKPTSEPSK